jgi:TonB family protein
VENGKKGTVMVTFIVKPDGKLTDVANVGAKLGYGLDEEAIRAIKDMPDWEPAQQNGKVVSARFNIPVKFSLEK